ncbi:unnamed protein product [Phytophthora fragariaefolia]|uniref:Unnamed protein product n=1 Tax=Phytophthora fragariaefolia TaxID=1490495 RepID=A0A9W6Y857_9STRA|nr:unnamed protein product [Phytophthora fragariaefolia]
MPKFGGKKDEDVADFMFSAKLYFESKNLPYGDNSPQQLPLSLLVASLQGPAAAWYREYVSHDGNVVHSVAHLEELLSNEFTAPDRQEHLRDQLLRLKQSNFACLEDYVSAFRGITCKVEDMSDNGMHFQKGLVTEIQQEVKPCQFGSTTEAISFALRYKQTHRVSRGQGRNQTPTSSTAVDGPTPIAIGNSRMISREECMRRNLCLYCKEPGHRLAQCRKRPSRRHTRGGYRPQGRQSFRANHSSFQRLVDDERSDDGEVEHLQFNMVAVDAGARLPKELLRFEGMMNSQRIKILIDSGAAKNIVRPGLTRNCVASTKVKAERFDGTVTPTRIARRCCETRFGDVALIEWEVAPNQDVILGIPWLTQFNPIIDWHLGTVQFRKQCIVMDGRELFNAQLTCSVPPAQLHVARICQRDPTMTTESAWKHTVSLAYLHVPVSSEVASDTQSFREQRVESSLRTVSADVFQTKLQTDGYLEVYNVNPKTVPEKKSTPLQLRPVIAEFADAFPSELPPELPPSRSIEHEVILKPEAKRRNRIPFGLSKVEQEASDIFVADLLKKNWIEVSDSPWVSNIFGVPKKDPVTGKFPSRLEWLHSNNPNMPIPWIIDYRVVNAASEIAKIPLPPIEELFDRMQGAIVLTILDLASGYHQMRMAPNSRQFTAF